MTKLVCVVLLAILTTADLLLGQYNKKTYYVEPRCGSSSPTGALDNPFASLQDALSVPGDDYTILFYPALYCETLTINKRVRLVKSIYGTSSDFATIGSKPYSAPIIEANPKRLEFDSSIEQLSLTICNAKCGSPSTIKISVEEPQGPFVIVGDCSGKTLLPGSECTVMIKCGFSESAVQRYLKIENSHGAWPEWVLLVSNRFKPPPPPCTTGNGGTILKLFNCTSQDRYVYINSNYRIYIPPQYYALIIAKCGETLWVNAKDKPNDSYAPITYSKELPGLCCDSPLIIEECIDY